MGPAGAGPHTQFGQVRARLAVSAEPLQEGGTQTALAVDDTPVPDGQYSRLVRQTKRSQAGRHHRALAAYWGDEALATGQVPERAGIGQPPIIGHARPPGEVKVKVGTAGTRHPGAAAPVKEIRHCPRPSHHGVEVQRHHPGQHVLGDPGHGRSTDTGHRRLLPSLGVTE